MAYEKDLEYLRGELKNSEDKLREAEINGYVTDAEMWESDVENLRYQIHIHERASKADEYKAKAEAFDRIKKMTNQLDRYIESDADDYQKGYLIGKKLGELHELVNEGDSQ